MNLNVILGTIGLSLLAFVAAFAIGRQNRPTPAFPPQTISVESGRPNQPELEPTAADLSLQNTGSMADEDAPPAALPEEETTSESAGNTAMETAVDEAEDTPPAPARPTPAEVAAKKRAAENRVVVAARRAYADQIPDDFKKYYAQELPEDAISSEQNVRTMLAGEQAEVITLSSRAFNAENKDFVLQQVRSELQELGFKRVYITNGRGFKTNVGF